MPMAIGFPSNDIVSIRHFDRPASLRVAARENVASTGLHRSAVPRSPFQPPASSARNASIALRTCPMDVADENATSPLS